MEIAAFAPTLQEFWLFLKAASGFYVTVRFLLVCVLSVFAANAAEQIVYPGWLKVPSPELVLDIRHEGIKPSARRDAGEFVLMVMRELIRSGFTLYVSEAYLGEEIAYYESSGSKERYPAISQAVLACLKRARESGTFDWEAFRNITIPDDDPIAAYDYFPWLSPPDNPERVRVQSTNAVGISILRMRTRWEGLTSHGSASIARKELASQRARDRSGIAQLGSRTEWRFAVAMRLTTSDTSKFEKLYLWEPWPTRTNANDFPVGITSARVLNDIRRGLEFSWEKPPSGKTRKTKGR